MFMETSRREAWISSSIVFLVGGLFVAGGVYGVWLIDRDGNWIAGVFLILGAIGSVIAGLFLRFLIWMDVERPRPKRKIDVDTR
jgi:hypothetical protein